MTHPTPIPPPAVPGFVGYDELQAVADGLTAEQEIRDRSLARAISLLHGSDLAAMAASGVLWQLADQCGDYIRDGSRP